MSTDYAKRPRSRLLRQEKKRAFRTSIIFFLALIAFVILFGFLGINLLARLSLLVSHLRAPKTTTINQDAIPPTSPQLNTPISATSSGLINLNGFAEPQSKVMLYVNGSKSEEIVANESGEITFQNVSLSDGLNTIYAISYDESGNESARSATITIIVDDAAPNLEVNNPQNNAVLYGPIERLVNLEGTTDPQASLSVNNRIIVVNPDGTFKTQYELQEGDNLLTFIATDNAGNQKSIEVKVSYSP